MSKMVDTITVRVAKADADFTIVTADIHPRGLAYLIAYGLKQSLADSVAPKTFKIGAKDTLRAITSRFDAIKAGTIGMSDPVFTAVRARVAKALKRKAVEFPNWDSLSDAIGAAKVETLRKAEEANQKLLDGLEV